MPEMDQKILMLIPLVKIFNGPRDRVSQGWAGAPKTGFAPLAGGFTKGIVRLLSADGIRWGSEIFLMNPFVNPPVKGQIRFWEHPPNFERLYLEV